MKNSHIIGNYLSSKVSNIPDNKTKDNEPNTGNFFITPFLQKSGSARHVSVSFQKFIDFLLGIILLIR